MNRGIKFFDLEVLVMDKLLVSYPLSVHQTCFLFLPLFSKRSIWLLEVCFSNGPLFQFTVQLIVRSIYETQFLISIQKIGSLAYLCL
jgi:hypothetical protein